MLGAVFCVETSWEPTTSMKGRISLPILVILSPRERCRHLNKENCTLYVTRLLIHHAAQPKCVHICLQWAIYGGTEERTGGIAVSAWFLRKQWTPSLGKKKPFWLKHHSPFWFIALEKWEQLWHIPLLLCASSERSHTEKPGAVHRKQNIIHRSNCFLLVQLKPTDCKRLSFWYKTQIESVMLFPHKYSTVLFSLLFKSSSCQCLGLLQKSEHERRFLMSNSFWE